MYRWQLQPEVDIDLGQDDGFADQGDAEAWLSAMYPDLAEAGVAAVSLYDGETLVYGPMSLDE